MLEIFKFILLLNGVKKDYCKIKGCLTSGATGILAKVQTYIVRAKQTLRSHKISYKSYKKQNTVSTDRIFMNPLDTVFHLS